MSVSVAVKNTCHTVGEAPFWMESSQTLLYVDIKRGDVHMWNSVSGENRVIHFDDPVGFVIPTSTGSCLAGIGRRLVCFDVVTGAITDTLAEVEHGSKNRFNDGKCDSAGRLWAGSMGHDEPPGSGTFVPGLGSLYSLAKSSGPVRRQLTGLGISNGIAFSSDKKTMFFIDTIPRKVYAFDVDVSTGDLSNQHVFVDFDQVGPASEEGSPDGMCIDAEDNIWVACFGGGQIIRFHGRSGELLQRIEFPHAKQITSCCFGGPEYTDLYVTCGKVRLSDEEIKNNQPYAGSVFKVTGLGVKGQPGECFKM